MKVIEHKYHKIKALGDDENKDLLLFPDDEIVIEEKLDGANFRFIIKDGVLYFGTHTNDITPESEKDWLRCMNFIRSTIKLDNIREGLIYYGECMKKHTMSYDWENTPPFLGFDIMDIKTEKYLSHPWEQFEYINLPFVPIKRITIASAIELPITDDYVPVSKYSLMQAEGIVLKNYTRQIFAKYVRQEFKEKNSEVFGKNKKRATNDNDYFVSAYYTNARIQKQVFKLIDEGEKLSVELMHVLPRRVYMDIWEEEWRELAKSKKTYNFAEIQKTGAKRVFTVLQNIMQNNLIASKETI